MLVTTTVVPVTSWPLAPRTGILYTARFSEGVGYPFIHTGGVEVKNMFPAIVVNPNREDTILFNVSSEK